MLHDPRPPFAEGDVLSCQDAPEDEAPDEDDGEDEDDRIEPDFTHEGKPEPYPIAVILLEKDI